MMAGFKAHVERQAAHGRRALPLLPFLLLVASIAFLVRLDDISHVAESLYADDGLVFMNAAHEYGIQSLWMPYAGYHLLYQRVIALLASQLPSAATPYVFYGAWLASFFPVAWVLNSRGKIAGLNGQLIVFLVCAIALQPNIGGSFLFLCSSHFFLGIALSLYVCIPSDQRTPVLEVLFLFVASLSGPFSALLLGVLAFRLAVLRDFSSRKALYTVVPICGLVQAVCILWSQRIDHGPLEITAAQGLQALSSFLFFGKSDKLTYVAAGLFWSITSILFIKWVADRQRRSDRARWLSPLFAAFTAAALLFMTALSAAPVLSELSPLGNGARYYLVPYSLAFFVAITCSQDHRAAQTAIISLLSVICASSLVTVARSDQASMAGMRSYVDMQWAAYAKLQKIKPDLVIPINPPWPTHPPFWNAQLNSGETNGKSAMRQPILLSPRRGAAIADETGYDDQKDAASAATRPPAYFDISNHCATSNYLAIEVDVWRSRMGWARLSWGQPGNLDFKRSLERFYPDGHAVMQFAFRRELADYWLRLEPAEGVPESELIRTWTRPVAVTWKKELLRSGIIAAKPTQPGGETTIKEVRLFCLE